MQCVEEEPTAFHSICTAFLHEICGNALDLNDSEIDARGLTKGSIKVLH